MKFLEKSKSVRPNKATEVLPLSEGSGLDLVVDHELGLFLENPTHQPSSAEVLCLLGVADPAISERLSSSEKFKRALKEYFTYWEPAMGWASDVSTMKILGLSLTIFPEFRSLRKRAESDLDACLVGLRTYFKVRPDLKDKLVWTWIAYPERKQQVLDLAKENKSHILHPEQYTGGYTSKDTPVLVEWMNGLVMQRLLFSEEVSSIAQAVNPSWEGIRERIKQGGQGVEKVIFASAILMDPGAVIADDGTLRITLQKLSLPKRPELPERSEV